MPATYCISRTEKQTIGKEVTTDVSKSSKLKENIKWNKILKNKNLS